MKDALSQKAPPLAKGGALFLMIFSVTVGVLLAVRDRSFWLDESFVYANLTTLDPLCLLLSREGLIHGQLFPRFYLFLLSFPATLFPESTLAPRLVPLLFGLAGFGAWLLFFYERYALNQKRSLPFLCAGGLICANVYGFYYLYELKSYSAEFFFSGLFFFLYFTRQVAPVSRMAALFFAMVASALFCYGPVFLVLGLGFLMAFNKEDRETVRQNAPLAAWGMGGLLAAALFVLYVDVLPALSSSAGTFQAFWRGNFISGSGVLAVAQSFYQQFTEFLIAWWKTRYGFINEGFFEGGRAFIWDFHPFRNADFRHALEYGAVVVLGASLWRAVQRKGPDRDPILLAAVFILISAAAAFGQLYPWGQNRLTLFAMPVAALLLTEVFLLAERLIAKLPKIRKAKAFIWVPVFALIVRNAVFVFGAVAVGPFMGNIKEAVRLMDLDKTNQVYMGRGVDHILRSNRGLHRGLDILYGDALTPAETRNKTEGKTFYYLWSHTPPPLNEAGAYIFPLFMDTHDARLVHVPPPALRYGLALMTPKNEE